MEPELKAEWVSELRSGKYRQASGALTNTYGKYCCLGVLCEILVEKGRVVRSDGGGGYRAVGEDHFEYAVLPGAIGRELFGTVVIDEKEVPNVTGIYDPDLANSDLPEGEKHTGALATDNDRGKTFAEIADVIEAEF